MAKNLSLFSLLILFHFMKISLEIEVKSERKSSINDERPFRTNKINLIFQKAKNILPLDVVPKLYSDFVVQDRLEIDWKKRKGSGLDEDGEHEALIRRKFLGILNRFDLLDVYRDVFGKLETNVFDKDEKHLFAEVLKKDKKLAKLWKKAEMSAFSEEELVVLKAEFSHHVQKIAEYEQLKTEIDRLQGISENSKFQSFRTDKSGQIKRLEKYSELKKPYSNFKESFDYLEKRNAKGISSESFFKDPRIGELWSLAIKANLSGNELESFRSELGHFEHKINKHEYFIKEAELAKADMQMQGSKTDSPEFYQQMHERVASYAYKIKKWYDELKTRISKSTQLREL